MDDMVLHSRLHMTDFRRMGYNVMGGGIVML